MQTFFEQQLDPAATQMAAFPARDREAFVAHWTKILADDTNILKTILYDGEVAGNIVSWEQSGEREVGYWLGREYWGRGIASRALAAFLDHVTTRPLYAHVARHNLASIRMLEKCGFTITSENQGSSSGGDEEIEEVIRIFFAHERQSQQIFDSRSCALIRGRSECFTRLTQEVMTRHPSPPPPPFLRTGEGTVHPPL